MTQNSKDKVLRDFAPYMALGTQLVATVAVFGIIGWYIDKAADSSPLWLLVFLIVGAVAGMYSFLRQTLRRKERS